MNRDLNLDGPCEVTSEQELLSSGYPIDYTEQSNTNQVNSVRVSNPYLHTNLRKFSSYQGLLISTEQNLNEVVVQKQRSSSQTRKQNQNS